VLAIGDVHGGAGALTMDAIAAIADDAKKAGGTLADAAVRYVDRVKAAGDRVPGFGHRVHTTDPRVAVLFKMAKDAGVAGAGIDTVLALDAALASRKTTLPINVDGALAAILYDLGFPPSAGKLIFIAGRVAGLTAEVAEEHAREKPMRIRIPVAYDGPPPRDL
jgi:citrate synthase